jgi:hypothetical protein
MAKKQYSGPWQRIRKQILERDSHLCQIQGPTCTQHATQVDHITPVAAGGAWYDPHNLRAACANCNNKRSHHQKNEQWRTAQCYITLVYGPPGSGKTTYVTQHRRPGDLVIDYDQIAKALGGEMHHSYDTMHDAVNAARNAVLRTLRQGKVNTQRAWIISANPHATQMFPYHQAIRIDPGIDVVLERLRQRNTPHLSSVAIDWYTAINTPSPSGMGDNGPATSNSRNW